MLRKKKASGSLFFDQGNGCIIICPEANGKLRKGVRDILNDLKGYFIITLQIFYRGTVIRKRDDQGSAYRKAFWERLCNDHPVPASKISFGKYSLILFRVAFMTA